MRNDRPSFMRSAIAAAISSSFICTTSTAQYYEVTSWDPKTKTFRAASKIEMKQEVGDEYLLTSVPDSPSLAGHSNPYTEPFIQGSFQDIKLHVTAHNTDDGLHARTMTISISKKGQQVLVMEVSLDTGETSFKAHPEVIDKAGIPKLLKLSEITSTNTGVVTPHASGQIFQTLQGMRNLNPKVPVEFLKVAGKAVHDAPPFMLETVTGAALPDTVTVVDVETSVAAITTAFAHTPHMTKKVGAHPFRGDVLPSPVELILSSQPGYLVGAKDASKLPTGQPAPLCTLEQQDNTSPVLVKQSTVPPIANAYIELFRYGQVNGKPVEHTFPRENTKWIKTAVTNAQLNTLMKLNARWQQGLVLERQDIHKLLHDQRFKMLCEYQLKNTKQTGGAAHDTIKITTDEWTVMDTLVTRRSLPTHIRAQFHDHSVVGGFVMSDQFTQAVTTHVNDIEPDTTRIPRLTQYYHDVTDMETRAVALEQSKRRQRSLLEDELRGPLKLGPGDDVVQATRQLAKDKDDIEKARKDAETKIRADLGADPDKPIDEALQSYKDHAKQEGRAELAEALREPLKAGPHVDDVVQATKQLAQARDAREAVDAEIRTTLHVAHDQPIAQAVKEYKDSQAKLDADLRTALGIGDKDDLLGKVQNVLREKEHLGTTGAKSEEAGELQRQIKSITDILHTAEGAEELTVAPDATPQQRLEALYTHFDGKNKTLRQLQRHQVAIDFVKAADFATNPWLNPDLLVDADLLTADEFNQLKELKLPKEPAGPLLDTLQEVEMVVVAFKDKAKSAVDLANDLDGLRRQFFTPPDGRGEKYQLDGTKKDAFEDYIKTTYNLDELNPIMPILEGGLSQADLSRHVGYVNQMWKIRADFVQDLTKARIMQGQFEHLTHDELVVAHQHFHTEEGFYRDAWNQHQLNRLHAWLKQQASVPTEDQLKSYPQTHELPTPGRLHALREMARITMGLDVAEVVKQVRAAGHLVDFLPKGNSERNPLFTSIVRELENVRARFAIPDVPDGNTETRFKEIARGLKLSEDSWVHLHHGARHSPVQWVELVKQIIIHQPDIVMPTHTSDKDILLARSGFDSDTVSNLRKLAILDLTGYKDALETQAERNQKVARKMEDTVTWAVKAKGQLYSIEELQDFPDDHQLTTHIEWFDPLKAFYQRFPSEKFTRTDVLRRAQYLVDFTPDEYNKLVFFLDRFSGKQSEHVNGKGIIPDKQAEFEQGIINAGLEHKKASIIDYVNYDTTCSAGNAKLLKDEALALHGSGISGRGLKIGHVHMVADNLRFEDLVKQRRLSRQLPDVYAEISEPAKTSRWLMSHPGLLVDPDEIMPLEEFRAVRQFVKAVIVPLRGERREGSAPIYAQKNRLKVVSEIEFLLNEYKEGLFTKLQTELQQPDSSADNLVYEDGVIKDRSIFGKFASKLGIDDPGHQARLARYLAQYPKPEYAAHIATHTRQLMDTGKRPSQITETQMLMAGDDENAKELDQMLGAATAHREEYGHVFRTIQQQKMTGKATKYKLRHKGLTEAKKFTDTYGTPGATDYTPEKFQTQQQLAITFLNTRRQLGQITAPDAQVVPQSNQTPKYGEVQVRLNELATAPGDNLGEINAKLDGLLQLDLVTTSANLDPYIQAIYRLDLPPDAVKPLTVLPEDLPQAVQQMLDATRSHQKGPRQQEVADLQELNKEQNPTEFIQKFRDFEGAHGMTSRRDVQRQMDELQTYARKGQDNALTGEEIVRIKDIIKPWVMDEVENREAKAGFSRYLSSKDNIDDNPQPSQRNKVFADLNKLCTEDDQAEIQATLQVFMKKPQVKSAYEFVKHYEELEAKVQPLETIQPGFTDAQQQTLEELRAAILELKTRTGLPGADELGMENIEPHIRNVDDSTPHEELLQVGRTLTGTAAAGDDVAEGSPLILVYDSVKQVGGVTAAIKQQKRIIGGNQGLDLGEYDPDYIARHQKTINAFSRDCRTCQKNNVWTTEIKLKEADMADANGYPDQAKLRPKQEYIDKELPKATRRLALYTKIQSEPGRTVTDLLDLEQQVETEEAKRKTRTRTVGLVKGSANAVAHSGYVDAVKAHKNNLEVMERLRAKRRDRSSDINDLPLEFQGLGNIMAFLHTGRNPVSGETLVKADQSFLLDEMYDRPVDEAPIFNEVATVGITRKTVEVAPLPPGGGRQTDSQLLQAVVDVDISSPGAIVLSDLVRLGRAGIDVQLLNGMDFSDPMAVNWVKALRVQPLPAVALPEPGPGADALSDENVIAIVGRLKTHSRLIPEMLDKVPRVIADEGISLILTERSRIADHGGQPLPVLVHQRHLLRIQLIDEFSHAVRSKSGAVIAEVADDIENAVRFYSQRGPGTPDVWEHQARLGRLGLTKEKCIAAVRMYSHNANFLNPERLPAEAGQVAIHDKIAGLFRADITNAPLSAYQVLGRKLYNTLSAQVSLVSKAGGNLMWVYAMNRVNLYLDDIAYNEGKGLVSALTGTGQAADELLLMSGLTSREHLVVDIVRYFGGEAAAIYKEYFEGQLGPLDTVMGEYIMPAVSLAAQAVQFPVSLAEVGIMMKMRPDAHQYTIRWNVAYSMGYAMVRVIADIGRTQSQLNKQMITAVDPAARRFAVWLDGQAPRYSDTTKPEDRYYQKLWESIFNGWNKINDGVGNSVFARAIRPFAELTEDMLFFKIYGGALSPVINKAAWQYEAVYRGGWLINDWARKDLAGTQYGLVGLAELLDMGQGLNPSIKGSWTYSVVNELPNYSLSAENTYFAEGEAYASFTPVTNVVKGATQMVADAGHYTGLDDPANSVSGWAYKLGTDVAYVSRNTYVLPFLSNYVVQPAWNNIVQPAWNNVIAPAGSWTLSQGWGLMQKGWEVAKSAAAYIDGLPSIQPALEYLYGKKVTVTDDEKLKEEEKKEEEAIEIEAPQDIEIEEEEAEEGEEGEEGEEDDRRRRD